jgi:hypothetical protein
MYIHIYIYIYIYIDDGPCEMNCTWERIYSNTTSINSLKYSIYQYLKQELLGSILSDWLI